MDQGKSPDGGTPDGEARPGRRARPGGGYVVVWFPSPLRRGRVNGGRLDPAPDALGRDGERADVHAERRQGVLDRVGDGGGPGDGPALADALGPEGREGRGVLEAVHLDGGHVGGGGLQIVHEGRGEELSLLVVAELLEKG